MLFRACFVKCVVLGVLCSHCKHGAWMQLAPPQLQECILKMLVMHHVLAGVAVRAAMCGAGAMLCSVTSGPGRSARGMPSGMGCCCDGHQWLQVRPDHRCRRAWERRQATAAALLERILWRSPCCRHGIYICQSRRFQDTISQEASNGDTCCEAY